MLNLEYSPMCPFKALNGFYRNLPICSIKTKKKFFLTRPNGQLARKNLFMAFGIEAIDFQLTLLAGSASDLMGSGIFSPSFLGDVKSWYSDSLALLSKPVTYYCMCD